MPVSRREFGQTVAAAAVGCVIEQEEPDFTGADIGCAMARHRDDWSVLQLAYAFEQATRHVQRRPAL